MKIGILTYHRVINDGSVMQTFCLQKLLDEYFVSDEILVIDYQPRKLFLAEIKKLMSKSFPFFRSSGIRRYRSIRRFLYRNVKLTNRMCISNQNSTASKYINSLNFDLVVVGSDTVWEMRDSLYVPSPINAYYLKNVAAKKVSFAASADPILKASFPDAAKAAEIVTAIGQFDKVSVRDNPTKSYLVDLGLPESEIILTVDPTLLYDFSNVVNKVDIYKSKPIAGLHLPKDLYIVVEKVLRALGYDCLNLSDYSLNGSVLSEFQSSLPKRLGLYQNLDILVSDRFHTSIFGLKLTSVPIIFVEHEYKWPNGESKVGELFGMFDLPFIRGGLAIDDLRQWIVDYIDLWPERKRVVDSKLLNLMNSRSLVLDEIFDSSVKSEK